MTASRHLIRDAALVTALRHKVPEWMKRADCQHYPADTWFPDQKDWRTRAAARAICKTCKVQQTCLEYALERRDVGIWGGLSERQRAELRRLRLRGAA